METYQGSCSYCRTKPPSLRAQALESPPHHLGNGWYGRGQGCWLWNLPRAPCSCVSVSAGITPRVIKHGMQRAERLWDDQNSPGQSVEQVPLSGSGSSRLHHSPSAPWCGDSGPAIPASTRAARSQRTVTKFLNNLVEALTILRKLQHSVMSNCTRLRRSPWIPSNALREYSWQLAGAAVFMKTCQLQMTNWPLSLRYMESLFLQCVKEAISIA